MAVIQTTPAPGEGHRTFTNVAANTIIGVRLAKTIPAGDHIAGSAGSEQGDVKVRPTNVTATIGTTADTDPDYIVLHNGPNGGFTQELKVGSGTFRTNAVVTAVITTG